MRGAGRRTPAGDHRLSTSTQSRAKDDYELQVKQGPIAPCSNSGCGASSPAAAAPASVAAPAASSAAVAADPRRAVTASAQCVATSTATGAIGAAAPAPI